MFTVELRNEIEDVPPRERFVHVEVPHETFDEQNFPLLQWISSPGSTVYNRMQCKELIAELNLFVGSAEFPRAHEMNRLRTGRWRFSSGNVHGAPSREIRNEPATFSPKKATGSTCCP